MYEFNKKESIADKLYNNLPRFNEKLSFKKEKKKGSRYKSGE